MTETRAEIGKRKRARTRASLMAAAMTVFARLGPEAAKIDDVIAEAGVARGTFYNYFATLDDLLVAIATAMSERFLAESAACRGLTDPADRLACTLRRFIRQAVADPVAGGVIVRIALLAAPLGATMRKELTADLQFGLMQGRFRLPSVQAGRDLVLGLGLMGIRTVLRGDADAGHAEHVATMALRALGVAEAAEIATRPLDDAALATRSGWPVRDGEGPAARVPRPAAARGSGADRRPRPRKGSV